MGLRRSSARSRVSAALVLGIVALHAPAMALAAPPEAGVLSTTTYPTRAVAAAAGQLAWLAMDVGQVTVRVQPLSGGAIRVLASVAGPPAGTGALTASTAAIAFDGTQYVAMLDLRYGRGQSRNTSYELIAGTVGGSPRVVLSCNVKAPGRPVGAVAVAGGQAYVTGAFCDAPRGLDLVGPAGPPTSVDPTGKAPMSGAGTWLAYTKPAATQVTNVAGAGSYLAAALGRSPSPLLVNADGQAVIGRDLVAPGAPLRTALGGLPAEPDPVGQLLTADRLVYVFDRNDTDSTRSVFQDTRIRVQSLADGASQSIGTTGHSDPVALAIESNQLTVLSTTCTGQIVVRNLDLTKLPAGGVSGCPVKFAKRPLLLTGRRLAVPISCPNGCRGHYEITDDPGNVLGKPVRLNLPPRGTTTLHFTLSKNQVYVAEVRPESDSPWLYTGREWYSAPVRVAKKGGHR
jgi:hypothetical protein